MLHAGPINAKCYEMTRVFCSERSLPQRSECCVCIIWSLGFMPLIQNYRGYKIESQRKQKSKRRHPCSSWKHALLSCVGEPASLISSWILQQVRSDIWRYTGNIWSAHLQEQASLSLLLPTWWSKHSTCASEHFDTHCKGSLWTIGHL